MESIVQGTKILTVQAFKISLEVTQPISKAKCIAVKLVCLGSCLTRQVPYVFVVTTSEFRGLGGIERFVIRCVNGMW
jgi:hypothetical protein